MIKKTQAHMDMSTAMTCRQTLKSKLFESLEIEHLKSEHTWGHLPDIDNLLWEGHVQEVPDNVLVDIDHTIAHAAWRDNMIGNVPWDEYHRWGCHDRPVQELVLLLSAIQSKFVLVGITGRPEAFRGMTQKWLIDHGVPLDELMMRGNDDYRPNARMKLEMAKEKFGEPLKDHIAFVIDDNEEVISVFAGECVTTLQVTIRRPVNVAQAT